MASVLETFLILFRSNADDIEDGTRRARDESRRMGDEIGRAGDIAGRVGEQFKDLVKQAGMLLAAYVTVESFKQQAEDIDAMGRASKSLGQSVSDIDAFSAAAETMGSDLQGALDSLTDVTEAVGDAMQDSKGAVATAFKALGVSVTDAQGKAKKAVPAMLDLADAVAKVGKQQGVFQLKAMGITDNRTIDLLMLGRKRIEELIKRRKELGGVTEKDVDAMRKWRMALADTGSVMTSFQTKILTSVLPPLAKVFEAFADFGTWLSSHKSLIIGSIVGIASVFTAVFLPAILTAAAGFIAFIAPIGLLVGSIAAIGIAIGAVIEDFIAWRNGQSSLIGEAIKKWPILGDILKGIISVVELLINVVKSLGTYLVEAWTDPEHALTHFVDSIKQAFAGLDTVITAPFESAYKYITHVMSGIMDTVSGTINDVKNTAGRVAGFFGFGDDATESSRRQSSLAAGNAAMQTVESTPLAAVSGNAISNQSSVSQRTLTVQTGDIVVNTQATDADGVASAVGDSLQSQLRDAAAAYDDGVQR